MKTYLNKQEKAAFVYALIIKGYLTTDIKDIMDNSEFFTEEEKKQFHLAGEALEKFTKPAQERLDQSTLRTIYNTITNNEIDVIPKKDFTKLLKQLNEDQETLWTFTEASLFKCLLVCNGHREVCALRDLYKKYSCSPIDRDEGESGCEYRTEIKGNEKYKLNKGELDFNFTELNVMYAATKFMADKNSIIEVEGNEFGSDMLYIIADRLKQFINKETENGSTDNVS